jgi:DNA-directed RNA polymerase specialized sigma24 family protein
MAMGSWEDDRRRAILTDPRIRASIRSVLKGRGVQYQDRDDLVQQVLAEAWTSASLPLDDVEDARRYLGGMARYMAIDHSHERKGKDESLYALKDKDAAVEASEVEENELAEAVVDRLTEKFPRTADWFLRNSLHEEPLVSIAQEANVSPGFVRHEVSNIRRTALTLAKGLCAAAALLALVQAIRSWRRPFDERELSTYHVVRVPAPTITTADELRERAERACNVQAWQACVDDFNAANELAPEDEKQEQKDMLRIAISNLAKREANPDKPSGH